jgi:hypothetical protein
VTAANYEARIKFRFRHDDARCVGMVVRYESLTQFFVASVCRAVSEQPSCVTLRSVLNGVGAVIATGSLPSELGAALLFDTWYELVISVGEHLFALGVVLPDGQYVVCFLLFLLFVGLLVCWFVGWLVGLLV